MVKYMTYGLTYFCNWKACNKTLPNLTLASQLHVRWLLPVRGLYRHYANVLTNSFSPQSNLQRKKEKRSNSGFKNGTFKTHVTLD